MKLSPSEINKYITTNDRDFKRFKMHYTPKEIRSIESFKLNTYKGFNHFGSYKNLKGINEFLSSLGENDNILVNRLEKIINNIIKKVLKGYKMEHFWMTIRVSMPNNLYDIPRWHKDGSFFPNDPTNPKTSKFVTVMKGPGTLLIKGNKRINKIYDDSCERERNETTPTSSIEEQIKVSDKYRPILAKELSKEKVIQLKNNQGLVFFTGNGVIKKPITSTSYVGILDNGALHSEPKIDAPRMFISIIPGTEENIMALQERWSKKK